MKESLRYLPEFNAFGIEKSKLNYAEAVYVTLGAECYERLGLEAPAPDAPRVMFLLGQDGDFYTIDFNYAYAIAKNGVFIVFGDYLHCASQVRACDGLILPGGAFVSPQQYYRTDDVAYQNKEETSVRAEAYRACFHRAAFMGIPILGICAGMQMIAGESGCFLGSDINACLGTQIAHKTTEMSAHEVDIMPGTLLYKLVKCKRLPVNSRHKECVREINNLVEVNAVAPDGCLEAFTLKDGKILCVQWHPEDYVVKGDERHFAIYKWLADEARAFQKRC